MKLSIYLVLALVSNSELLLSQSEKPTTARIIGDIPDGTPPPPEPPRPKFIVPAEDVITTKSIEQGGRQITFQKIAPITLPPPVVASPVDITDPALQARIADFREETPTEEFLLIGANVFKFKDAAPITLVEMWPQGQRESITFWSSADFGVLSGFSTYVGSDEITRSLFMMWSVSELKSISDLEHELGPDGPKLPDFPPGKATFQIISGNPTPQTLTGIQSLHDLYNSEYDRLLAAHQGRERARLQQETELKANPPQPKDLVINYWRIEASAAQSGGAK